MEKLNIALNSHFGERIIANLGELNGYSEAVLTIWHTVKTRDVRLSNIIKKIRFEIQERKFDVFISCKSQDYSMAKDLYMFLKSKGMQPFLADTSIKEMGVDKYTAVIGEVINVCQYMIVFATDIHYVETPYVAAEWHAFINDINSGHKSDGKIVSILSPEINPHSLPVWLRDKQSFTIDDYQEDLMSFLSK